MGITAHVLILDGAVIDHNPLLCVLRPLTALRVGTALSGSVGSQPECGYALIPQGLRSLPVLSRRQSSHLVTKLDHAALVGFDLRQVEGDVAVELPEEWDPITNQDREDRITNFVG